MSAALLFAACADRNSGATGSWADVHTVAVTQLSCCQWPSFWALLMLRQDPVALLQQWDGSLLMPAQLSATDISAWAPMKGAAKRDNLCELQNSVNQWPPERALHSWASLRVCLLQCFFCSTVARFGSAMPPCASACCWRVCQRRATGVAFVHACTCFVVSLQPFSGICVGDVADACGRATVLLALLP